MNKTAMQELIEMMNEKVKQYSDNAQQEAIFFAIIEEAKKQLDKEKEQIINAYGDGFMSADNPETYYQKTYNQ